MNLQSISFYAKKSIKLIRDKGFKVFIKVAVAKVDRRLNGYNLIQQFPTIHSSDNYLNDSNFMEGELIIISGVPYDDIGGGQRAAQLARCALKTGKKVVYLYIYKKYDFEKNIHVESDVSIHGLQHIYIGNTTPNIISKIVSANATLVIEHPHPDALPYLEFFNNRGLKTVFELIDDWETSLGGDWFNLENYQRFVRESTVVVGTAKLLVKRLEDLGREDAIYLPNAANEYIFDKYRKYSKPFDMPSGYNRIALYFGSLYGEWFGWDYITAAAKANPKIAFVLIGDKPTDRNISDNVFFLGAKDITELPAYLAHSDITLLPFVPGKISDAVSPIKIFEYLFLGKPVIATQMPEIVDYPGVFIANDPVEFATLCKKVEVTAELISKNDIFISENSWFSRLDNILTSKTYERFHKKTSAVILIHNNANIIIRNLQSLIHHCDYFLKEIIVVDNMSIDGGAELVASQFPNVKIIKNDVNGCSSGRNLGAKYATGQYLAFFDSDQWFTSFSSFTEALNLLEKNANIGIIGWGAGWFDVNRSDLGGMISDYCPNRGMNAEAIHKGYRSDIGYLGTCGVFMSRTIFEASKGFDTFYDPTCFEDTDLCFQIKALGFDVCYRDLTGIRHQPHQTTKADSGSDYYEKLFNRNANYFKEKWSSYPEFYVDYKGN
ncbi:MULTISPECIES: glycosyltransferase [Citrobacter]|uniref:Polysaccharide pyruvyl transferase n=2 Tax=Citrobacter freundii complex TaxID=1344959 RepID=A0A2Z4BVZ6_CITBR|nr:MULTISPECIES: glycosyltransferase [Citrobacter]AWU66699.1 polysaccharide pyruvyl transferase [Citrobacter werkmanii]AWU66708.1 polysaccharide pyruvyl transferase [Citrobacter braakii]MDH1755192.1 glycosyltransferase [Citrobacter braakii]MDH1853950.1 glycosyltransferase [Citrobacter braakii]MDM3353014.1 glycosyltransferase [Citrobacter sp. Cb007]